MNVKLIGPDGEGHGYFSGYDLPRMTYAVLVDYLKPGHGFVAAIPASTVQCDMYAVYGITAEGVLTDTGFKLDTGPQGWSYI